MTLVARSVLVTLLAVVAAVALVAAYLLGHSGGDDSRAVAAQPAGDEGERYGTITMTGAGEATGVPDQLTFKVAVSRTAPDVTAAMDQASTSMSRVLAALERAGVQRKDTETTGLSIDPEYRYYSSAPRELVGHRVRQSGSVLVRDLSAGGEAIAAAVRAGGNAVRVSGIGLRIGDHEALMARARESAVDDATAKATQYAEAAGQPLGQVLTVREGRLPGRTQPVTQLARAYDTRDTAALEAVPIRAGSTDLAVTVTVVWALAR